MPGPDDSTSRLVTAAASVGTDRPQLAVTLANSDLQPHEIRAVGGFAQALTLATTQKLAQDSGAQTNFTQDEQNTGAAAGIDLTNPKQADSRSWLEKALNAVGSAVSNTGTFLLHNPVMDAVNEVGKQIGNVAHLPFRLLSSALDTSNDAEIDREMKADGYDPNSSASYLAFMYNQGENIYHNLDDVRATYGDQLVDTIAQAQRDPEGFQAQFEKMDPTAAADLKKQMASDDWANAAAAMDQKHISPGRDIARLVLLGHTNNAAFRALSGTLDAAYDWFADPTLILGKGAVLARGMDVLDGSLQGVSKVGQFGPSALAARGIDALRGGAQRAGLRVADDGFVDQAGIEALLRTDQDGKAVTAVGKGWERLLSDVKDWRNAAADAKSASTVEARQAAEAKAAGIYRAISNRHSELMPLVDEIAGTRVVSETEQGAVDGITAATGSGGHVTFPTTAQPIEDLKTLSSYLSSTNGLLRLHNGMAAKQTIVMPGRLSIAATRKAAADTRVASKAESRAQWIRYGDPALLPNQAEITGAGDQQFALTHQSVVGQALRGNLAQAYRVARGKFDEAARRISTTLPTVDKIDLNDGRSSKTVEQFARIYLNKGDAAKLASSYALGNIADRRRILKGAILQSFHASGMPLSEDGTQFMQKFIGEMDDVGRQQYGLADSSKIIDADGKARDVALYPDQLATTVAIPNMKQMHYLSTKFAVGGFARASGLSSIRAFGQGANADALMTPIKLGWITSIAGGLRNALDEVANIATYRMGREYLSARSAFTQATRDVRAERRAASVDYLQQLKASGLSRSALDAKIFEEGVATRKTVQEAQSALDQATSAQYSLDNLRSTLGRNVTNAQQRAMEAENQRNVARDAYNAAKADPTTTEEQLAAAKGRRDWAQQQHANARAGLKKHADRAADPDKVRADLEQRFADKGVLSVDDATAEHAAAMKQLEQARTMESAIRYRVPLAFRQAADTLNDVFVGTALGKAMSVFGKAYAVTPDRVKYATELVDQELTQTLREGIFQSHYNDSGLTLASDEYAMDLHRAGLRARKYQYVRRYDGFGEIEPDGGAGLDAWAKMLQLRFADPSSPAHAWVQTMRALAPQGRRVPGEVQHLDDLLAAHADDGKHVYRVVSKDDYDRMRAAGVLNTDGRANITAQGTKMLGSTEPNGPLRYGEHRKDSVLLKIERRPEDGWRPDSHDANPNYVATGKDVPFDRVVAASPYRQMNREKRNYPVASDPAALAAPTGRVIPPTAKDWQDALQAAKDSVRARLDEHDLRHFVDSAEVLQTTKGGDLTLTDALKAQAKDEYAERVSTDLASTLGNGSGQLHQDLLDMLADGEVPDRSWLANNVPLAQRPPKVIGQLWGPYNPAHQPGTFPVGYTQMLSKAYNKVVTDQINAISRNPLVTALYINARENTKGYEAALKAAGWDDRSAAEVAKRVALNHAGDEALKHIDNPYVASQFSLVHRNYAAFVRAQEDWLRRWGHTIRDNPQMIRQAQLLVHGGTTTGLVEKDDQGNPVFVYPGSRLALNLFGKLFGIHGLADATNVPLAGELTSNLMLLNPSLDNPIGLSATPLISLPVRAMSQFLGNDHALLKASLDRAVNGDMGAGRKWYETMLPGWANRIMGGLLTSDPGSKFGAAYTQALANMEAAGQLDDPALQTASGKARFQQALGASVRNNLAAMTLFSLFAPAAPSYDPEATGAQDKAGSGNAPDWSAHIEGLRTLKDEARQVFSRLPYEEALAWWQAVHPGELIYAQNGEGARTVVGTRSAQAPATVAAARYMEQNADFMQHYGTTGGIGAYFIPQGTPGSTDGSYSDAAYQAQLEMGIRSYKPLDQYFDDVVTARGASQYYAAKDQYDAAKADAQARGSLSESKQLDADWANQKAEIFAGNPLLQARFAQFAVDNSMTGVAIQQVAELLNDNSAATSKAIGANRAGVAGLYDAYLAYQQGVGELADSRSNLATKKRQDLKDTYTAEVQRLASGPNALYPELADLARGVFRLPN